MGAAMIWMGSKRHGFHRYLVTEGGAPGHRLMLGMPLRWEGDDS